MPVLMDERHDILQYMLLGRKFRIEFRANSISPPTAAGLRGDNIQAVPDEFFRESRVFDQTVSMYSVQINHYKLVWIWRRRLENIAGLASDGNGRPRLVFRIHGIAEIGTVHWAVVEFKQRAKSVTMQLCHGSIF
jgi:hypothetical protein